MRNGKIILLLFQLLQKRVEGGSERERERERTGDDKIVQNISLKFET